jgi:hypothetical protein
MNDSASPASLRYAIIRYAHVRYVHMSWSAGESPGLDERPVQVVLDIDLTKFEALAMDLLSRRRSSH